MGYLVESFNNVFVVSLASFNHSKYLATVGEREKGKEGEGNVDYLVESFRGREKSEKQQRNEGYSMESFSNGFIAFLATFNHFRFL